VASYTVYIIDRQLGEGIESVERRKLAYDCHCFLWNCTTIKIHDLEITTTDKFSDVCVLIHSTGPISPKKWRSFMFSFNSCNEVTVFHTHLL